MFSKFSFLFHLKNHHSKDVNLKFWLKSWSQLPIPYCVGLIMVTISRHIFINIFQICHELIVIRRIWAFVWYQNLQKFEKKLKNRTWLLAAEPSKGSKIVMPYSDWTRAFKLVMLGPWIGLTKSPNTCSVKTTCLSKLLKIHYLR